jgi:isoleucyl-tRNA synthetase
VSAEGKDKEAAIFTLYMAIVELSKMMAPFAPFISEYVYRDSVGGKSVFLDGWPAIKTQSDKKLEKQMSLAKEIVEQVNAARDEATIKLRWPVEEVVIKTKEDLKSVEEVISKMSNAKGVKLTNNKPKGSFVEKEFSAGSVFLNKKRSPEIIEEGLIRDLMRHIQNMRKKNGLKVDQYVHLKLWTDAKFAKTIEKFKDEIMANTSSKDVTVAEGKPQKSKAEAKFEGKTVWLGYDL